MKLLKITGIIIVFAAGMFSYNNASEASGETCYDEITITGKDLSKKWCLDCRVKSCSAFALPSTCGSGGGQNQ